MDIRDLNWFKKTSKVTWDCSIFTKSFRKSLETVSSNTVDNMCNPSKEVLILLGFGQAASRASALVQFGLALSATTQKTLSSIPYSLRTGIRWSATFTPVCLPWISLRQRITSHQSSELWNLRQISNLGMSNHYRWCWLIIDSQRLPSSLLSSQQRSSELHLQEHLIQLVLV